MSGLKSVNWSEFLRNESGKESVDRLLLLLSFPFATLLAIKIGTVEALGVYLASYGLLAGNNKWASRANNNLDSTQSTQISLDADSGAVDVVSSKKNMGPIKPIRTSKKRPF